jgi:hypothetical protein
MLQKIFDQVIQTDFHMLVKILLDAYVQRADLDEAWKMRMPTR